jgi:2-methylaconitate cis-trans-isomerase PrpF
LEQPHGGKRVLSRAIRHIERPPALAAACVLPGTLANRIARVPLDVLTTVRIEHPGGQMDLDVEGTIKGGSFTLTQANLLRTTRRLFSGMLFIPSRIWDGRDKATDVADISQSIEF